MMFKERLEIQQKNEMIKFFAHYPQFLPLYSNGKFFLIFSQFPLLPFSISSILIRLLPLSLRCCRTPGLIPYSRANSRSRPFNSSRSCSRHRTFTANALARNFSSEKEKIKQNIYI